MAYGSRLRAQLNLTDCSCPVEEMALQIIGFSVEISFSVESSICFGVRFACSVCGVAVGYAFRRITLRSSIISLVASMSCPFSRLDVFYKDFEPDQFRSTPFRLLYHAYHTMPCNAMKRSKARKRLPTKCINFAAKMC